MPFQRKPKLTLLMLDTLLNDAKERDKNNLPDSMFTEMEKTLGSMKNMISNIEGWEKTFMEKFCGLEDIFKDENIRSKFERITKQIESIDKEININKSGSESSKSKSESDKDQKKTSVEWSQLSVEDGVSTSPAMSNLEASFDYLDSSQLKLCLLCLSVFPEKYVIKKRPLIYWWIGEGLVTKTDRKTAEEVGEDVFQQLIKQGLIEPYPPTPKTQEEELMEASYRKYHSTIVDRCVVHPWIRRVLILIAKKAGLFEFDSAAGTPCSDSRRAFLRSDDKEEDSSGNEDTLPFVTVFNESKRLLNFKSDWLSKLKKVVVLQLGRWQNLPKHHIEIEDNDALKGLGPQKLLRYLSLQGISRITSLPQSITELFNLEILDLRACHNLETLPSDISTLKNLTHLDVSECYLLESMPRGMLADHLQNWEQELVEEGEHHGPEHAGCCSEVSGVK